MQVLFLAAGCLAPASGHPMTWRTLSRGLTSGLEKPLRKVIRDEAEFLKFWAAHAADVNRPALPPKVDFGNEMVIAIAMGNRPTGGYLTEVVDIQLRGRTLKVLVAERSPEPGVIQIQRATQPFQFVALPIVTGRIEFRSVREAVPSISRRGRREESAESADGGVGTSRAREPVPSPKGATQ